MEGISIIIPVFNKIETTMRCIDLIREQNTGCSFEIIIVDNGSTDKTSNVFNEGEGFKAAFASGQISYIRNPENLGVAKAQNRGAESAKYGILCFMHNDVFIYKKNWVSVICNFIFNTPAAGVVGLYGAKTIREDGSFRGKTIVHAKRASAAISRPFEKVAVVDGLIMAMKKNVFNTVGGFCEDCYVHYYDKDISLRAFTNGLNNFVLDIPFEHICGTTRNQIPNEDIIRDEAQRQFVEKWKDYLPADVSTWGDKMAYIFKKGIS
jgi:GT2 family glycosyltransferase